MCLVFKNLFIGFLKRLPAMYGGTNFHFFLGWTTVVIVLFSKKSDSIVFFGVGLTSDS